MAKSFGASSCAGLATLAGVALALCTCERDDRSAGDGDDGVLSDNGGDIAPDGADGIPTDADGETTAECMCSNPLDDCTPDDCVRRDYACDALHGCDTGYECAPDGRCHCADITFCGFACSATRPCPATDEEWVCASDGICRPPLPCFLDAMCPTNELCIGRGASGEACAAPGTGVIGASCSENTDCLEGSCHSGSCVHRCFVNANCESGLLCGRTDGDQLGCMVTTDCPGCLGPDEYCYYEQCRAQNCRASGDCESRNCMIDMSDPTVNAGECRSDAMLPNCSDDELFSIVGQCFIPWACWIGTDCPAPYLCADIPGLDGMGVCSRPL